MILLFVYLICIKASFTVLKFLSEITAFSDRAPDFEKLNTQILGVSVDSQFSHLAWIQTDRKEGGVGKLQKKESNFKFSDEN